MSDIDRRTLIAGASLMGAVALARAAKAGQLSPPAGPVEATGRSLRDVEPRTPISALPGGPGAVAEISQPGAYVLTGEMHVPAGMTGIRVTATGPVSIDLRGFAISGSPGGPGTPGSLHGIECKSPTCSYLEIYDGFIRDCGGDGIDGSTADTLEVDDVDIQNCGTGIRKALGRMKCSDVTLERMAGHGIVYAPLSGNPGALTVLECVIDDCEASACGGSGIQIEGDYSGLDVSIWICDCDCHGCGLDGIGGNFGSTAGLNGNERVCITIDECNCASNGRFGIGVQAPVSPLGNAISVQLECCDCTCAFHGQEGMRVQGVRATFCDCDCVSNGGSGMYLQDVSGSVECCLCSHNGVDGMTATNVQGVIDEVDCMENVRDGMNCTGGSGSITACECSSNGRKGQVFTNQFDCDLCEDITRQNGQGGFHIDATCSSMCIADCAAYSTGIGFQIEGSSILLIRNTATGNSVNYAFDPATNPTVVIAPSDMASSCNPHANYAF